MIPPASAFPVLEKFFFRQKNNFWKLRIRCWDGMAMKLYHTSKFSSEFEYLIFPENHFPKNSCRLPGVRKPADVRSRCESTSDAKIQTTRAKAITAHENLGYYFSNYHSSNYRFSKSKSSPPTLIPKFGNLSMASSINVSIQTPRRRNPRNDPKNQGVRFSSNLFFSADRLGGAWLRRQVVIQHGLVTIPYNVWPASSGW